MQFRFVVALVSALAAAVGVVVPVPVTAQTSSPLLTPWGKPDVQGVWDFRSLTPMERPSELGGKQVFTAEEAAKFEQETVRRQSRDLEDPKKAATTGRVVPYNDFWFDWGTKVTSDRTSLIVDPPDGQIPPLTPEAASKRAARAKARGGVGPDEISPGGWIDELSAQVRCLVGFNAGPPMTPSAYNNNMQLIQTPDHVVILTEMIHEARIVPLDGRPQLPQHLRHWMGSSRGRWEGNTLVVETTNRRDESFREAGRELRVIERFTRADANTLVYEVTLEAPETWTKPWTFMVPMAKSEDQIYEYACHEANYYMENMLRGKRAEEAASR